MPRARRAVLDAEAALARRDPLLARAIGIGGPCRLPGRRPPATHFAALTRAICFQQLAGAAARTIHGRFVDLFPERRPTAEAVRALPPERLRGAGLSGSKAASVRDLAQKVLDGDVDLVRVARRSDEEVVEELVLVRGIGRWTAEMFLMFQLGRLDVWPVDDYGVRNGFARLHGLAELPTARELGALGDGYRPFRSVAAWYCWRAVDTVVPA